MARDEAEGPDEGRLRRPADGDLALDPSDFRGVAGGARNSAEVQPVLGQVHARRRGLTEALLQPERYNLGPVPSMPDARLTSLSKTFQDPARVADKPTEVHVRFGSNFMS